MKHIKSKNITFSTSSKGTKKDMKNNIRLKYLSNCHLIIFDQYENEPYNSDEFIESFVTEF